jgi:hypothetical protein
MSPDGQRVSWWGVIQRELQTSGLQVGVWVVVLGVGVLILRGRFDLSAPVLEHTSRSYASSVFLFVLTLPAAHYLLRNSPLRPRVVLTLTGVLYVLLILPYRWLNLTRWHYDLKVVEWNRDLPEPQFSFLPSTFPVESFPGERAFFPVLWLAFAALAIIAKRYWTKQSATTLRGAARAVWPWLGAYTAILVQSWLHTGLRSGYTANTVFSSEPAVKNWHLSYLFSRARGAVNADFDYFWSIDQFFHGVPQLPRTLIFRRPFAHYFAAQFSYFTNPYRVYLVINTVLWLAAAACCYAFVLRVSQRAKLATWSAALVCIGNGFSYFVAQPKSYLAGYASAIIALYAFDVLQSDPGSGRATASGRWLRAVLCGVVLGLLATTYDSEPMLCGLLVLAVYRRFNLLRSLASIVLAFAVPWAYSRLVFEVLGVPMIDPGNQAVADQTRANLQALFVYPQIGRVYYLFVHCFTVIAQNLTYAFMLFGIVLALIGMLMAKYAAERFLIATLLVPALILDVTLSLGQVPWVRWQLAEFPRLTYIAYPAIYVASAVALDRLAGRGDSKPRLVAAWSVLVLLGLWQNCDAFGFLSPVVHFYYPDQAAWLDRI